MLNLSQERPWSLLMKATVSSVSLRDQFSYVNSGGPVSARSSTPDSRSYDSLAASLPSIRKNRRIEMRLIGGLVPAGLRLAGRHTVRR